MILKDNCKNIKKTMINKQTILNKKMILYNFLKVNQIILEKNKIKISKNFKILLKKKKNKIEI